MSAHTPGPWTLQAGVIGDNATVWAGETAVCTRATPADGALIAAAPEMLEALQRLLNMERRASKAHLDDLAAARAIVAKATVAK